MSAEHPPEATPPVDVQRRMEEAERAVRRLFTWMVVIAHTSGATSMYVVDATSAALAQDEALRRREVALKTMGRKERARLSTLGRVSVFGPAVFVWEPKKEDHG